MFILKVTNKESGLVEQTNFLTKEQCLEHKAFIESNGYIFIDRIETIPAWTEVTKEAWFETIPAKFDENGIEVEPEQQISHDQEVVQHDQSTLAVKATHDFEIIEDNRLENIQRITELESKVTNRRIREALLTGDYSFIRSIEDQISAIRSSL